MLETSKGLKATEPKDLAYAMLWAFPSSQCSGLNNTFRNVDYTKSLETIYTEYTIALLGIGLGALKILRMVNNTSRNLLLPSWVPDFSVVANPEYETWTNSLFSYDSSKSSNHSDDNNSFVVSEGQLLRAWGIVYSKVNTVIRQDYQDISQSFSTQADAIIQFFRYLKDLINASRARSMAEEKVMEALYGAFTTQFINEKGIARSKELLAKEFRIFSLLTPVIDHRLCSPETQRVREDPCQLFPEETVNSAFHTAEQKRDFPPFLMVFGYLMIDISSRFHVDGVFHYRNKDLFITESGSIGMAYRGVQEGDVVAIWRGCPCPIIVRKHGGDEPRAYRFHAPAYVDGIMNGEA